jgi:hypothetical protein
VAFIDWLFAPACARLLGPPIRLQRVVSGSADAAVSDDVPLLEVSSLPELPPTRLQRPANHFADRSFLPQNQEPLRSPVPLRVPGVPPMGFIGLQSVIMSTGPRRIG